MQRVGEPQIHTEAGLRSTDTQIKWLFVAVIVVFALQNWFVSNISEPYPALLMPGFSGSGTNSLGEFVVESADVVVTFSIGEQRTITLKQLFAEAPSSQFPTMARIALKPKGEGAAPERIWGSSAVSRFILGRFVPGYVIGKVRRWHWTGVEPATVEWVRRRLTELFPNQQPIRVDIRWFTEVFTWRDGQLSRKRTPGADVVVAL